MFVPLRDSGCTLCPLHKDATTVCVTEFPQVTPKWLLIGEGPGFSEDQEGLPFIGKSGELLNNTLSINGLNRSDFYVSNTVRCRPPDNRKPQEQEILACTTRFLIPEFQQLKPDLVVLLGNTALHTFTNRTGITRNRGIIPWPDHLFMVAPEQEEDPHIPAVFCTIHPSAALRSTASREIFEEDIKKLSFYISHKLTTIAAPIIN